MKNSHTPPKKQPSDEILFDQFRRANQRALTPLYNKYKDELLIYLIRLVRTHRKQDAEDLLQEVWMKVCHNSFSLYEEKQTFKSWLFIMARRVAFDWNDLRRNKLK